MLRPMTSALRGRRVLVVEDDFLIANDFCQALAEEGATAVGPAPSIARALAVLSGAAPLDAAILDINLGGELVYPVAESLRHLGVPFVFASGYDHAELPQHFADAPYCEKPVNVCDCIRKLWDGPMARRR